MIKSLFTNSNYDKRSIKSQFTNSDYDKRFLKILRVKKLRDFKFRIIRITF